MEHSGAEASQGGPSRPQSQYEPFWGGALAERVPKKDPQMSNLKLLKKTSERLAEDERLGRAHLIDVYAF